MIGAAAPLGAVVGATSLGRLSDRLGRKLVFAVDLGFFVVFSLLSAAAWNVASLIAFRFLLGVGIGADYPLSSTYVSEFMPARLRGRMMVGGFSFQALGALAGAGVGLLILLLYPHESAWRWMLGAGVVPAVLVVLMRSTGAVVLDIFLVIGFGLAIWLVDRWGRLRLQLLGFAGMTVGLLLLAAAGALPEGSAANVALVFLGFALFNLMVNMGPNPTTFLLPAELFPTSLRASGHGLAASAGKVGAAVGVFLLPVLKSSWGLSPTLAVVAVAGLLGLVVTWIFGQETRGQSLEDLT